MGRPQSIKSIRRFVESILEEHGIFEAPVPIEELVSKLGGEITYAPYDDGELSGMLFRDKSRIVIGINSTHHPNRQRFTIGHELGHMLLHKTKKEIDTHIDRIFPVFLRDAVSSQANDPLEIDANRFSAELLMPYKFLINDIKDGYIDAEDEEKIEELARKYRVSVQAMTFRISNILV